MAFNDVYEAVDVFCNVCDVADDERKIISEYVQTGKGRAKMDACADRTVELKDCAEACKPVMTVMAGLQRDSEEFAVAFRFWEYLTEHVQLSVPKQSFYGDFFKWLKAITDCGYGIKEALFLMTVNSDYGSSRYSGFYDVMWSEHKKSIIDKVYDALYNIAFGLSYEEITFNKRLHVFFHRLQSGLIYYKAETVRSVKDIKELLESIRAVYSIPFVGTEYGSAYRIALYALGNTYRRYIGIVKDKHKKDWTSALVSEGDSVFTYAEQMRAFCTYVWYDVQQAFNALVADEDIRAKLFSREIISEANGECVLNRFQEVINAHGDERIILDGLCFSPSKKVASYCSDELDKRKDRLAAQFKEFIKTQKFAKNNTEIIAALLEKWSDQSSSAVGFSSLKEVEEYAAKQKLASTRLLDKFDYSTPVYGKDKRTVVSEKVLKVFLDKYFSMKDAYRNRACDSMVKHFDKNSFEQFIDGVYAVWEASDFDNKLKAAMIPYCFYASNAKLYGLRKQCIAFCDASRHVLASNIVRMIALNGGKYALMLVDGISNKFPYNKVKQVAKEAMAEAAEKYAIPVEVLADLIIPECGFDKNGKKALTGAITLTLMPSGEIRINRGDKILKSLPSDIDAETKKEFSAIKKDVKTIIKLQTVRLERAMLLGRCWTYKSFARSYVTHPVMRLIVTNLIWGRYTSDGKLLNAFHVGLDGSTEDSDYEEVKLNDDDIIALLHPCDLSDAEHAKWAEYITDNEIKQPFVQMGAKVCFPLKVCKAEKYIDLTEYPFNNSHLQRLATRYDMQRTETLDGGAFDGYYLEDKEKSIGVELDMQELFFGAAPTDGRDLKVFFYEIGEDHRNKNIDPYTVPTRFVSSILASLSAMVPTLQFADSGKIVKNEFKPYDAVDIDFDDDEAECEQETKPVAEASETDDKDVTNKEPQEEPAKEAPAETLKVSSPRAAGDSDYHEYLEFVEGTSSKFWQIDVRGDSHTVVYGRIGTDGREVEKSFGSAKDAMDDAKKLVDSKIKKGYTRK